jgi:periplasmic protein TonB
MNPMRLPAALSIVGHAIVLALLLVFAGGTRPPPEPLEKRGIEVMFSPSLAQPRAVRAAEAPIQPAAPPEESTPPLPAPEAPPVPVAEVPMAPPDQTVTAEAPPPLPPHKPVVRQKPKYAARQPEPARPSPTPPAPFAAAQYAAAQYAAAPAAAASLPGPDPTVSYRALVSAWFESHKRYPDSAREHGEEGNVALRFRVDRYGRVIDYALLTSTGYADLDQGVERMMSGAQLPPFPPGMTAPEIEVSVRIGFSLTR